MKRQKNLYCPCGSNKSYTDCCGTLHHGKTSPDAEALMRSRYTAYVMGIELYLLATWHFTTRPTQLNLAEDPSPKWLGLKVMRHAVMDEDKAVVEFVARYQINGRAHRLHEISHFTREGGQWFYVDGEFPEPKKA